MYVAAVTRVTAALTRRGPDAAALARCDGAHATRRPAPPTPTAFLPTPLIFHATGSVVSIGGAPAPPIAASWLPARWVSARMARWDTGPTGVPASRRRPVISRDPRW